MPPINYTSHLYRCYLYGDQRLFEALLVMDCFAVSLASIYFHDIF